jgi:hypothetical protein
MNATTWDRLRRSREPSEKRPPPADVTPRVRMVLLIVSLAILAFPAIDVLRAAAKPAFNGYAGIDYVMYMDAARRWLDGGSYFHPYQLAGPYSLQMGDVLYPPNALLLFVPFALMPALVSAIMWWAVPLGATAAMVWRLRPSPVAWPFLALCVFWPPFVARIIAGNPVMWAMAAVALGFLVRWAFLGVLIKPSLFPFALLGMRDRRWWIGLVVLVLVSIPFGSLWIDWVRSVVNATGGGLLYSMQDVPILLLPVIAAKMR